MLKEKCGLSLNLLQKAGNQLENLPHRVDVDSLKVMSLKLSKDAPALDFPIKHKHKLSYLKQERGASFKKSRYIVHAELNSACKLLFRFKCFFARELCGYLSTVFLPALELRGPSCVLAECSVTVRGVTVRGVTMRGLTMKGVNL